MNEAKKAVIRAQIAAVIPKLNANNMSAAYAEDAAEACRMVEALLKDGETVATGGSATLAECGVMELLQSGRYHYIDRNTAKDPEELRQVFLDGLAADTYLCSSNAVTMNGELFNVDGNANRVAALCYGPRRVILVVGCNKLVKDLDAAIARVKTCAAPPNTVRLHCDTPCAVNGSCAGLKGGMTAGCNTDARICCTYVVSARQRHKDRIHVILVGESLGF